MKPRKTLQRRWDDFFRKHLYIRRENWDRYARVFRVVIEVGLKNLTHPLFGPWLRRLVRFEQEGKASSFIVPIHQDVAYLSEREGTVLPVEKIRRAIEASRYRIIMHRCICRDAFHCTNYPRDFACIMLGEACRHLVAHGIARSVTVAEALDHLDRATRLGLVGTCAWTEMESIAKGIPEAEKLDYFEICFCCPCCCSGLRNYRYWHRNETLRKHFTTMGWRAQGTAAPTVRPLAGSNESWFSSGIRLTSTTRSASQRPRRNCTSRSVPPASGRACLPGSASSATASSMDVGA